MDMLVSVAPGDASSAQPAVGGVADGKQTQAKPKRPQFKGRKYVVLPGKEREALEALEKARETWEQGNFGHSEWLEMHKVALVPFSPTSQS